MHGVANNQDSPTNYIVIVDRAAHRVGVFKGSKYNWADTKYYKCCVGKPSTPTISGTYYIKSRGKYFDTGTKGRCWYFTQINGNYLFHSVIYDRQNSPKRIIDNSMDAAVSHGCVRLDLENAKWIYDNIPKLLFINIQVPPIWRTFFYALKKDVINHIHTNILLKR